MKTISKELISTKAENYGEILEEITFEVTDDYDETVRDERNYHYFVTENISDDTIIPVILAFIAIALSLACLFVY
jgi:hypothetical protein